MQTLSHIRSAEAPQAARSSMQTPQALGGVAFGDVVAAVGGTGERLPPDGSSLPPQGLENAQSNTVDKPVSSDKQDHRPDDVAEQVATAANLAAEAPAGIEPAFGTEAETETETQAEQDAGIVIAAGWSSSPAQQPTVNFPVGGGVRPTGIAPGTAPQVPSVTPLAEAGELKGPVSQPAALETASADRLASAAAGDLKAATNGVITPSVPLMEGPFRRLLSGDSTSARITPTVAGQAIPMAPEAGMPLLANAVASPGATTDSLPGQSLRQERAADALALAGLVLDAAAEPTRDEPSTRASLIDGAVDGDTPDFGNLSAELRSAPASVRPLSQMLFAPGTPAWAEELGDTMLMMVARDQDVVELKLNPGQLGTLEVRLETEDDKVKVAFFSQSGVTRDALDAAMPRLRELLASGGLQLADAQVSSDAMPRDDSNRGKSPAAMHLARGDGQKSQDITRAPLVRISHEGRVDTFA